MAGAGAGRVEFATEVYNYQTASRGCPKNLIMLCTTQGLAIQQDGSRKTRLYHHSVHPSSSPPVGHFAACQSRRPTIHRHWLEAEATRHAVGGPQQESMAEKLDALQRGKATACVIGPRALGQRFNVLMTIQVPLEQQQQQERASFFASPSTETEWSQPSCLFGGRGAAFSCQPMAFGTRGRGGRGGGGRGGGLGGSRGGGRGGGRGGRGGRGGGRGGRPASAECRKRRFGSAPSPFAPSDATGISKAARVSRGGLFDTTWTGLAAEMPLKRHSTQRITITVVLYNVVAGGVPAEADVVAAIDDLERLYAACRATNRSNTTLFNDKGTAECSSNNAFVANPQPFVFPTPGQAVVGASDFPTPKAPQPSFGQTVFSPLKDVPYAVLSQTQGLPVSEEGINYCCTMGNSVLNNPTSNAWDLYQSLCYFRLGNDTSVQLRGVQDPTNLYNMACVCSRLSLLAPAVGFGNNLKLPPWCLHGTPDQLRQAAMSWLVAAVGAGWSGYQHMQSDPDLEPVRFWCKGAFEAICALVR